MNTFNLFIVTREHDTLTAKTAIENLLMELTTKTDVTAIYNSTESLGQFQYWTIKTSMERHEISTIIHQILNDFNGDDDQPWWTAGHHPHKIRRHQIIRTSVYDC